MARSLRSLLGSGLTAAPTPRSILAPPVKTRRCHHLPRQRQPGSTCDPVSNHAGKAVVAQWDHLPSSVRDRLVKQAELIRDWDENPELHKQIIAVILKFQGYPS